MLSVSTAAIAKAHPYPLGSLKCPFGRNPYRVCTEPLGPSRRDASAAQFSEAHFGLQRSQSLRAPMRTTNRKSKDKHSKQEQEQYYGTAPIFTPREDCVHIARTLGRSRTASRLRLSASGAARCGVPLFFSFLPRPLREVLAKKSAPPAPLCPQPGPSLPLSPHTVGAVPHLHGAMEERERRSPSPPREATAREGDEERQSQRDPPRSLREVLAMKSAPPAPLCPQPGPSLPLSPHTMGAVPHLHGAMEERERRSPSPPREATTREGDEERQSQRGNAGRQRERAERGKEPEPTGGAPGGPC
eukprot:XP_025008531.1 serine/arginine repetitive matrix protein 1-like [Gallus gallus]